MLGDSRRMSRSARELDGVALELRVSRTHTFIVTADASVKTSCQHACIGVVAKLWQGGCELIEHSLQNRMIDCCIGLSACRGSTACVSIASRRVATFSFLGVRLEFGASHFFV